MAQKHVVKHLFCSKTARFNTICIDFYIQKRYLDIVLLSIIAKKSRKRGV